VTSAVLAYRRRIADLHVRGEPFRSAAGWNLGLDDLIRFSVGYVVLERGSVFVLVAILCRKPVLSLPF